jgi:hypothetical protein
MQDEITTKNSTTQYIDVIATKIDYMQRDVAEIKSKLDAEYVTQDQFEPVKKLVYGMVSIILVAVMGAIVALVIRK